jgi:hypothetical protein
MFSFVSVLREYGEDKIDQISVCEWLIMNTVHEITTDHFTIKTKIRPEKI